MPRVYPSIRGTVRTTTLTLRVGIAVLLGAVTLSCQDSGGGSARFDGQATLIAIRFPDPLDINVEPETEPPQHASLVQSIVFEFSGRPNPDRVTSQTIQIRDLDGSSVNGQFFVVDTTITFVPDLPTEDARETRPGVFKTGGTGLAPANRYSIRVGSMTWPFVNGVDADLLARFGDPIDDQGIALTFATTDDPTNFFRGIEPRTPKRVSVFPQDGAFDVSPQLYSDPDGRFRSSVPFTVQFDGPLHPHQDHLAQFQLFEISADHPAGLSLGVHVTILENRIDASTVEIAPAGILPLGRMVSLEVPADPIGLSQDVLVEQDLEVAATYTIADAEDTVHDDLIETFETQERWANSARLLEPGEQAALWTPLDTPVLQAAFVFPGQGELGRLVPAAPGPDEEPRAVVLDTNTQPFPLLDGSTPDAPAGVVIYGGHFHFTDIIIPAGVTLELRGANPAVLTATGSVIIEGNIHLSGIDGTSEHAFDSAVASIAGGIGGVGGGRGGESHPIIFWPPDNFDHFNLVSPPLGGHGFGPRNLERSGGQGGEGGTIDYPNGRGKYSTNKEISCNELNSDNNNGDKAASGGAGSYLEEGSTGRKGIGNVRSDGQGGWLISKEGEDEKWERPLSRATRPGDLPRQGRFQRLHRTDG